ncbi:MAG: T9SS type A sorting domain-containing protein [Muribaculaceae bacterium]|nr:T9SS type A sorting domain-containing protein [Muribaculaceae bacterium]
MTTRHSHINSRIIRGLRCIFLMLAFLAASPHAASAASPKWEQVKTEHPDAKPAAADSDTEIRTTRGIIEVSASRPVQIKVYTILGQLVSRENLPAGTSRLTVQAHGIYIIRIGDLTCKVAL